MSSLPLKAVFASFLGLLVACHLALAEETRELTVYLDAEFQENRAAARAIEVGFRTALLEHQRLGRDVVPLRLVLVDHRGNSKRSKLHMQRYLDDPNALAVLGGVHSPPYLENQNFVNENRILLLLPWSAAGPITRPDGPENWIFRLSVDDTKAGERLISHALDRRQCKRPALWLWDSGWGRTNLSSMSQALHRRGHSSYSVFFFPGNLTPDDARVKALELEGSGADCAILVANTEEGVALINALGELGSSMRVISHWGITGGNFATRVDAETRRRTKLEMLQTCYDYTIQLPALETARHIFADDFDAEGYIAAPAGFFHGHDLGLVLLAALDGVDTDVDIHSLRLRLHHRLENADIHVQGLLREYVRPFSPYGVGAEDAHEALGIEDLCFSRFDEAGRLMPPT